MRAPRGPRPEGSGETQSRLGSPWSRRRNSPNVLLLYVFNFSMVFIEICLWFRYHGRPISAAAPAEDEEGSAADTLLAEPAP